ncbi:TetR/AcrR family transcriptional regulator, partial [Streptomyces sp. SID3343]|nr:TetR/AcrR family transcriptional regulator [Streptomyces sp. SID3343]
MDGSTPAEHARIVELLWDRRERPRSGPKPVLSPELVTASAIAIADAEGLAAATMQRIAA